ncbi:MULTISPECIES: CBS domain-containing protein [unclassified Paenibacillus]|uniref:CBS domain-containing protein n=1 Tax=unclassified Paenibacillus TaxID=185978 RepID=UPI00095753E8|nr:MULTISPECIES: CBS domain-containing protein [unclassified Paenibacillus]ASS65848.1 CBS domain-containing protein [Paenibacillus sp. RUD330]SIQ21521.1 CBS domain-containing protein [Paenibacillus sp. RU4X]SIQ43208.1 CBS domain-containing protein [Paenibacillus sp. RU4T]
MPLAVSQIMSKPCITATLKDNVYELAVLMKDHGIGFVPIVEGERLVGVVTDRDLVVRGYAVKHSGSTAVIEVMTPNPVTLSPEDTAEEAGRLFAEKEIRRLPVVEDGRLIGVVAIGDLAVRDRFADEAGQALSAISEAAPSPFVH